MLKSRVYILATCRKERLLPATLLVFKTLRTGFPTAEVFVHGNQLRPSHRAAVEAESRRTDCGFTQLPLPTVHDQWIDMLLQNLDEPFWICDTDMIFHSSVEDWIFCEPLAGEKQKEWMCEYTRCIHLERLHTCLMRIEPGIVRQRAEAWKRQFRFAPFTPDMSFVRQHFAPIGGKPYFYDTCAGLYQTIGGQAFDKQQRQAYTHLHAATYADLSAPHISIPGYENNLLQLCAHPELATADVRRQQEAYFKQFQTRRK